MAMPAISRKSSAARAARWPRFGSWQTVSVLGQGRWSRVYRARPCTAADDAPADYAVKVAEPSGVGQGPARQLLAKEVLLGRAVSHRHLTCILASQLHREPYYLVMPYLEGSSLESLLEADPLEVPVALWIARQTLEALCALHQHGWLHGDVKPSNVFVSREGHVTLLDLGLARRASPSGEPERQPLSGTLDYLPPEAFSAMMDTGTGSDVYSLGVTLYRMLTSRLPFQAPDVAGLAEAHLHWQPPDPREFNPRLSHAVARLPLKMMAKQPRQRPDAEELISELIALEIDFFDHRSAA